MRAKRDEAAFQRATHFLTFLKQQEDAGRITLRYFDESGFSTTSSVPYGWQPVGSTYRIPCHRSPRLKVLGFMGRANQCVFHTTEHTVTAATVIAAFDAFAKAYEATTFRPTRQPCFVVLDNASLHRSHAFQARRNHWLLCGIVPYFIPPYCPELNLIEILWRQIKYRWLPMAAYQSFAQLKTHVLDILQQLGTQYRITFA